MSESAAYFVRVLGMFMLILLLIFILAVITPKLAKIIDKLIGKIFRKNNGDNDDNIYKVRGIYDIPKKYDNDKERSDNNSSGNDVSKIKAAENTAYSDGNHSPAGYGDSDPTMTEAQTKQPPD